ncbi:MAG: valine--tRNA ligase [Pseudomonadota bacterium]
MDKHFDAATAEARISAAWEERGCFRAGANAKPAADGGPAETFSIVIPPPNVTGSLHMGHALNNTLQDILCRWHRMRGFDVLWQPGQDHAGIATQMVVERALAAAGEPGRHEMGREAFVERVWQQKDESGGIIIGQLQRLGASCDWSRNRFTLGRTDDDQMSRAVLEVFVRLYEEGLIYRDKRLVNWDPYFETAISDLEVEQVQIRPRKDAGKLWRFRYPLADGATYEAPVAWDEDGTPTRHETRDYIVVATTRPETMLGDTGVAVHPDDARYAHLVGKHVVLPLVGRRIPIVADSYADPETGTGAVKITPAHDFNDFDVGKRTGLRVINVMTSKAAMFLEGNADFLADADPEPDTLALDGKDRYEARLRVVELMEIAGLLDGVDDNPHLVPHGDRSKVAIEPFLTDQWFCDAATLAKPALEAVKAGDTRFAPENWEKTYFQWLENIQPWCISRQLWWGHRIPVWYGPPKDDSVPIHGLAYSSKDWVPFCATDFAGVREQAEAYYEGRTAFEFDASRYDEKNRIKLPVDRVMEDFQNAGQEHNFHMGLVEDETMDPERVVVLNRDEDVLDTWFSSALWPFSTLGWPDETSQLERYYKTDVLVTGFDIIFFWVARMMMMGLHFMKDDTAKPEVPFHTVYVHALVRDEHGKKMSKTLGNVIDPLDLIDQYGADATRFTLTAMAAMGRDVRLSVSRVEGYRNFQTKLWNAARFCEMNDCVPVAGFDPASPTRPVNRWIVGETVRMVAAVDEALAAYRFNDAATTLYDHIWKTFCDWYLELSKPLLQGEDAGAQAETRATAAWALDRIIICLHPIMPFVTEALWEETGARAGGRPGMCAHADWPVLAQDLADADADAEMGWTIRLIEGIRSLRAEMNVPAGAKLELVMTGHTPAVAMRLLRNSELVQRMARLSEVAVAEHAPDGSVTFSLDDCAISLPLAGVIDVEAESARLTREIDKLVKERKAVEAKLANERFLTKAPAEIVAENRQRLETLAGEITRLEAALARLATLG